MDFLSSAESGSQARVLLDFCRSDPLGDVCPPANKKRAYATARVKPLPCADVPGLPSEQPMRRSPSYSQGKSYGQTLPQSAS